MDCFFCNPGWVYNPCCLEVNNAFIRGIYIDPKAWLGALNLSEQRIGPRDAWIEYMRATDRAITL